MNAPLFQKSPPVYVEIGQTSLKVLDGNDGLELSLDRAENGALTPECADRLIPSLRVFFRKHHGGRPRPAFCAIAARGVSLRRLTVPAVSRDELERVLDLQIEREFPLLPEELAWGYRVLSATPGANGGKGAHEVLVVAVKRDTLQPYAEILTACGLEPTFTLGALARSSLCAHPPPSFAVLDVGRTHSELISFEQGSPATVRVLAGGGEDFTRAITTRLGVSRTEAEKFKVHLEDDGTSNGEPCDEVRAAITAHWAQFGSALSRDWIGQKLYITGGATRFQHAPAWLAETLGDGCACERIELTGGEGRSAAILGLKKQFEENGSAPALALRLAPVAATTVKSPAFASPWKWAALAAVLAVIALSLRYAEPFLRRTQLAQRVNDLKARRAQLPNVDRELAFLQFLKTNQPAYLDAIHALASAAPPGTRVDSLSLSRRGDLSLRATMGNMQQMVDWRSKLIDSGLFNTVVADEQTPSSDGRKLTVRITGDWKATGQPRAPAASQKISPTKTNALERGTNAAVGARPPAPPISTNPPSNNPPAVTP